MYPIILQLGPITIYSLWLMLATGLMASLLIIKKLVSRFRLKMSFLANNVLTLLFGSLIGARIVHIIYNPVDYILNLKFSSLIQIFYIWDKGLAPWGAIFGGLITLYFIIKKEKEDLFKWVDVYVMTVLIILVFGNIGAFLDGRNFGTETKLPWGVVIENSIYTVPIHPTQIYAAIYCGIIAITLYVLSSNKISKKAGNLSIIALTTFSVCKFLEEFLRGDDANIILGLRETQILALLGAMVGGILMYKKIIKSNLNHDKPNS